MFTVTLKSSGRRFLVAPGETVLEAASRAGVALPYSCRAGVCGSCKATLLEGRCDYPNYPPPALDAGARAEHAILVCQAVPRSDLVIEAREVTSVEDIARRQLDMLVSEKWPLAAGVVGLRLRPAPGERRLRRLPGQYVDVLLEDGRRRSFSVANGPQEDGMLELHVRHVSGGGFTSWVAERLAVGDRLRIEGPLGTFVPREGSERPLVFIAGGTGFAPIRAIVQHFIGLGTRRRMHVYWGARTPDDLYLRVEGERWATEYPGLVFVPVTGSACAGCRCGVVHEAVLADLPELSGHDVYMSGPPAMIEAACPALLAAGLPEERLYYDSFEYAPEVLARILASRAGIAGR